MAGLNVKWIPALGLMPTKSTMSKFNVREIGLYEHVKWNDVIHNMSCGGIFTKGDKSLGYVKRKFCEELKIYKYFLCIWIVYCI